MNNLKKDKVIKKACKMASVQERFTVYCEWENFVKSSHENIKNLGFSKISKQNFEMNMVAFDEHVNQHLAEGWSLLGAPIFNNEWFRHNNGGVAIQALVRDKSVESAVVAEVAEQVIAENVRPVRSSARLARENP